MCTGTNKTDLTAYLAKLLFDCFIRCSICIDRMQTIEQQLNEKNSLDPVLISVKEKYTKAFFRYCNELCLSPQSRAKLANMNPEKEENPIFDILNDDD